ncbi:MAG: TIGR01212 family radical SAM protein [Planctomycetia bacterium]
MTDAAPPFGWREAGHRYYKYSRFLEERFGRRIARVPVDGGFTCPNADGTVAYGGCVYCDNRSFSPARRGPRIPILQQLDTGVAALEKRYDADGYLAYLQPATNTYGRLEKLKKVYDAAVAHPKVVGLIIGTRPDCVGDEVLDLIQSYTDRYFVAVEYGLQSVHQKSLDWMNRGHDAACFFDACERTKGRGIDVSAHVILGLPGETFDEALETIDAVAAARIDGVKIHSLHVVRDTPMEEQFRRGEISVLERDDYLELLIAALERTPGSMVVHRVTGDAPGDFLIAPEWPRRKAEFLQLLDREMTRRETWQGRRAATPAAV